MENLETARDMPETLRSSIEMLMLDTTEPLDPLLSLKLTNLTMNVAKIVYMMGLQDGRSGSSVYS
ncbi:MAG: hypothetical protein KME03_20855 [Aphanocapsa lilacina HA4352-LM1]|jgi:hypothetical protein|uniref:Uncharacterized protein n=1 Tax=Gloeobacter morelensis MG652769 TaxID=2781736 RepID=A0ABY3PKL3_9CYAN|nr:hypothetical protein [Gloeobacter morelensis]MBW4700308.1 hypothetical protein [Aphanocapsa lilacina HA4352-LM1]UFP94183.1 hypothetical protein ISF26_20865 [Gloeobacter morelensis MG652769]